MPPIQISYHSTQAAVPHTPRILSAIKAQLPLRNLHGKAPTASASGTSGSRSVVRSVQELDVELVQWGQKGERVDPREIKHGSLLKCPLVNVCFLECDDSEVYKLTLRPQLQAWRKACVPATSPCLIVLVHPSSAADEKKSSVFGNLKAQAAQASSGGGILGKLKTDFEGSTKKDRCIQLNLAVKPSASASVSTTGPPSDAAAYVELLNTLKDLILVSFDGIVRERDDAVRRGEAQRLLPGWAWGPWFLSKETLACSYAGMELSEDALIVYDELEASLEQVLRDGNAWVGRSGVDDAADDTEPLLPSNRNDLAPVSEGPSAYHERIAASDFSVFDYRCYIFRRQVELLGQLREAALRGGREVEAKQRIAEVARRSLALMLSLGRWLKENAHDVKDVRFLVEAWLYDAALSVVACCDAWAGDAPMQDPQLQDYLELRPQLLFITITQLDRAGTKVGFLPSTYPFLLSQALQPLKNSVLFEPGPDGFSPNSPAGTTSFAAQQASYPSRLEKKPDAPATSQRALHLALVASATFYDTYEQALRRTREAEDLAKREKHALAIDERQAALPFYRKDYKLARKMYSFIVDQLQAQVAGHSSMLLFRALGRVLQCDKELGQPLDVALALEYLRAYASQQQDGAAAPPPTTSDVALCRHIVDHWAEMPTDEQPLDMRGHPIFDVMIGQSQAASLLGEDGCTAVADVWNGSPVAIPLDDIRLCFAGKELEQLWFTSGPVTLQPGWNDVQVSCYMPVSGMFRLEASRILRGHLSFDYDPRSSATSNSSKQTWPYLRIPESEGAFGVALEVPEHVSLDETPKLNIVIRAGHQDANDVLIQLDEVDEAIRFMQNQAASVSPDEGSVRSSAEGVVIDCIKANSEIRLAIPYMTISRVDNLFIRVSLDYYASGRPQLRRAYRRTEELDLSLPVAVNVQDYFRPDCLISKFTVSSASGAVLQVQSAGLEPVLADSAYECKSCRSMQSILPVLRDRPLSFLFKITKRKSGNAGGADRETLRLLLRYSIVEETLREAIRVAMRSRDHAGAVETTAIVMEQAMAVVQDRLKFDAGRDHTLGRSLQSLLAKEMEQACATAGDNAPALRAVLSALPDLVKPSWRALEIPVDIPSMQIITSSRFQFKDDIAFAVVGRPLQVTLTLSSSYTWADTPDRQLDMIFDVLAEPDSWLIAGMRKGKYAASAQKPHSVELTLVPLRHGMLNLPTVIVDPSPRQAEASGLTGEGLGIPPSSEMHQQDAAKQVMVYPQQATSTFVVSAGEDEEHFVGTDKVGQLPLRVQAI